MIVEPARLVSAYDTRVTVFSFASVTPVQMLPADAQRIAFMLSSNGANPVFIWPGAGQTANGGLCIPLGQIDTFLLKDLGSMVQGAWTVRATPVGEIITIVESLFYPARLAGLDLPATLQE